MRAREDYNVSLLYLLKPLFINIKICVIQTCATRFVLQIWMWQNIGQIMMFFCQCSFLGLWLMLRLARTQCSATIPWLIQCNHYSIVEKMCLSIGTRSNSNIVAYLCHHNCSEIWFVGFCESWESGMEHLQFALILSVLFTFLKCDNSVIAVDIALI